MKQPVFSIALYMMAATAVTASTAACGQPLGTVNTHYVVLHGSEAAKALHQCSRPTVDGVTGTWDPPASVIRQLENDLPKLAAQKAQMAPNQYGTNSLANDPTHWYRQYVGVIVHGRRAIYINAWSSDHIARGSGNSWLRKATVVCDGGPRYWGALYDPSTESFSHLKANGVA